MGRWSDPHKCISKPASRRLCAALLLAGTASLALAQPQSEAPKAGVTLNSSVTLLESPNEPLPIQKATEDLTNDFAKVFGKKPRVVTREQQSAPVTLLIGERSEIPEDMRPAGLTEPESFSISVHTANWGGTRPAKVVLLAGADMRGTIYAIYQFSQDYLGIDPMYYWTDQQPRRRASIVLPASLARSFHAPLFKYRGFFLNDEDLLTGWAPGEKTDKTGISLAVWNKVYETILRLKGNMVVPGTWIFPTDPQVRLAGERGLILTQHHAIPLGVNVARWPAAVPYNYTTHPEILERAWKDAVNSYDPHQEILWAVGLRGLSDVTYAAMDPSVRGNDKALGALISKAIADQMSIVRVVHPEAKFVTDLWQEGARLVQRGDLTIPSDVIEVWADTGYGDLQDKGEVAAGQGAYYHVAMMNGRANQLTEMVPVSRIYSELGRYIKAGATQYLLLNTSDIRPVVMTAKAVMDVAWGGLPPGGVEGSGQYYRQWSAEEFGPKAAASVAKVYEEYFHAPAKLDSIREYGDQLYHTEARQMLLNYMINSPLYSIPSQSPKWTPPRILGGGFGGMGFGRGMSARERLQQTAQREIQQCGDAQPRWDAVWRDAVAAEPLVTPARRSFYHAEVLTMIAINRESNRILFLVSKAIQDAQSGQTSQARQEAEEALAAFDQIHQMEAGAEYGKWKNWYRGDWLTGIDRTREMVQIFVNYLNDPLTHLPPPIVWSGWEAYYHIMHYEGDRTVDVQ